MAHLTFEEIKRKKIRFQITPSKLAHEVMHDRDDVNGNKRKSDEYRLMLVANTYPSKDVRFLDVCYDTLDIHDIRAWLTIDKVLSMAAPDEDTDELKVQWALRRLLSALYSGLDEGVQEEPIFRAICALIAEVLDYQQDQCLVTRRVVYGDPEEWFIYIEGLWAKSPNPTVN